MSSPLDRGRGLPQASETDTGGGGTASGARVSVTTAGLGVVGAAFALLAGAWLLFSPFALGYQSDYTDWSDATTTDFWDGFSLAVVGLITLVLAVVGLVAALRATGAIAARKAPEPEPAPVGPAPAPAPADDLTALLRPLVEALNRDNADAGPAMSGATASNGGHEAPTLTNHRASLDPTTPQER